MHELSNRSLIGKTNRVIMFDELRTLHIKYSRIFTGAIADEVVFSWGIASMSMNSLYRTFVDIYHEIDILKRYDLEAKTLTF